MKNLWREAWQWFNESCEKFPRDTLVLSLVFMLFAISIIIGISADTWIPAFASALMLLLYIYKQPLQKLLSRIVKLKFGNFEVSLREHELNDIDLDLSTIENIAEKGPSSQLIFESIENAKNRIAYLRGKTEIPVKGAKNCSISPEVYTNANGKCVRLNNGIQIITKVFSLDDKQFPKREMTLSIIFPGAFAETPLFYQFVGITQPKVMTMNPTGMKIKLKEKAENSFQLTVIGTWKKGILSEKD